MLADNYNIIMENISTAARRCGRDPGEVQLIAVTKYVGIPEIEEAAKLGIQDFGENRVQEAAKKIEKFPGLSWHFIGHLQSNKAKDVLPYYKSIHSLDRLSLAKSLQRCGERFNLTAHVFIQVNTSGEESKFGLAPGELSGFLEKIEKYDRLKVRGLMTMAPFYDDPEKTRPSFRELRRLRDLYSGTDYNLEHLSMGMTNDYMVAIEEGATIIRVGSALFD
ncbi:MAG: YggS family pyridoxal phosphate-dependent enzyme [Bacillota bacterium]